MVTEAETGAVCPTTEERPGAWTPRYQERRERTCPGAFRGSVALPALKILFLFDVDHCLSLY